VCKDALAVLLSTHSDTCALLSSVGMNSEEAQSWRDVLQFDNNATQLTREFDSITARLLALSTDYRLKSVFHRM